jgi:glyoxylase-like metal-dependent hydrolase (beta-lactamase superfamily II)
MIQVKKITFNPFQENTIILFDETKECIIIDAGCYEKHEEQTLVGFIEENELKPVKLISTHSHIDHVLGNNFVLDKYNIPLEIHQKDQETLQSVGLYAGNYGFSIYQDSPLPTNYLEEGKNVKFGNSELEVLFVPGHAPGHVVFVAREEKFVINGDCLFHGSIGRTDLPGGDYVTLISSIKSQLFTLPDDFLVYCGHGPETTIGFEKQNNPFLK